MHLPWICHTSLSWLSTAELSPPQLGRPHVTTDPPKRIAANAPCCGLNLPYISEWIFDLAAVTTIFWMPPRNHRSVRQDRSKGAFSCLNLLRMFEHWTSELSPPQNGQPHVTTHPSVRIAAKARPVAWTCSTCLRILGWPLLRVRWWWSPSPPLHVTPKVLLWTSELSPTGWITPSNNWSIQKDRSKCTWSGLDLLYIAELILHLGAVATRIRVAPCNTWPICKDCSKGSRSGLNLRHVSQPTSNHMAVTTGLGWPDVTTDPSTRIAANALLWLESATHFWACFQLQSCHHHSLDARR